MAVSQTYLDRHTFFLEYPGPSMGRVVNHFCNTCDRLVYLKSYDAGGALLYAQWTEHSCNEVITEWVMEK